jgi:hypothetical protein
MYYSAGQRRLPGPGEQRRYFGLLLLALALLLAALLSAEIGPNPDYRPRVQQAN